MGKLKDHFHEVLAGEPEALKNLEDTYRATEVAYYKMLERLPCIWRKSEQQAQLDAAYNAWGRAKWAWETAKFWTEYEAKNSHQ